MMSDCPVKRKNKTQRYSQQSKSKRPKIEAPPNPPGRSSQYDLNWKKLQSELQKTTPTNFKLSKKATIKRTVVVPKETTSEIWFDDVSQEEIILSQGLPQKSETSTPSAEVLVKNNAYKGMTKVVGIDCEMVGTGRRGSRSALARVSIVNQYGKRIYDKHVRVDEAITDYRTWVSGIRPSDLKGAEDFNVVQREVAEILKDRVLVGHAIHNDLKALYLNHPKRLIRDTSVYPPFRVHNSGKTPSLKLLSAKILGVKVQGGEHSSVQDAQAAMKLYMMHKRQWEKELKSGNIQKQT